MRHEEFAELVGRRLEDAADRLETRARDLGIEGEASRTGARAGELRVAALLVREEAAAASSAEATPADEPGDRLAGAPPLRAQG